MNFLCHAMPYLDQSWVAVGTAVPDWLSAVDRKIRARGRLASLHVESDDPVLAAIARGIVRHHDDDRWFHGTEAFVTTNLEFAVALRDLLQRDAGHREDGFRPSFVGHILIEMLLDAIWLRDRPEIGETYYRMLGEKSATEVQRCVNVITGKPTDALAGLIERFVQARFLFDYLDDESLLFRLNQVMRRVGLAKLPPAVLDWLPDARRQVWQRRDRMLTPPGSPSPFPI